ncbi:MAG: SynChlorMet cassette protein ScmD [Victivallaceae bacterium]
MELNKQYPIANSMVVFREEFDDWAVLFDPDANETFGLNPVSAFIWKKLDGKHTTEKIINLLKEECDDVSTDAQQHIDTFLADLEKRGLVGFERA